MAYEDSIAQVPAEPEPSFPILYLNEDMCEELVGKDIGDKVDATLDYEVIAKTKDETTIRVNSILYNTSKRIYGEE